MTLSKTQVRVGDQMATLSRTVTQEQIGAYAESSGDLNPIHTNEEFARMVGLPGTIAHGMLNLGILTDAVARWAGGGDRVHSISCRFSKPLLPGDTITCRGTVVAVDEERGIATLDVGASSDRGDNVLTNGRAEIRLAD
ncbi:MAG TPA: MaoC/PaaZ C-terminal domain-containing protein [Candidatus Dormibacteraeota bacterium]|jgi:acyl dehydratase|nr:MaoC/PaaZ C-terminal domain-containing protein [Candidatus Dormibacteraeota bacterium]